VNEIALIVIKALGYLAMALALGSVLGLLGLSPLPTAERRVLIRMAPITALLAALMLLAWLALEVVFLAGGAFSAVFDTGLVLLVLQTPLGQTLAIQLGGLAFVAAAVIPGIGLPVGVLGSVLVAAGFGLGGHPGAHGGWLLPILITLHWLALGFWVGVFIPLYRICGYDMGAAAMLANDFGRKAVIAVAVLVVAGGVTLYQLTDGQVVALQSAYSQLFALKLSLFAGVLLLAAMNKWALTPALNRGDSLAPAKMRRSLVIEGLLLASIMAVTAVITTLTGPTG
jgi:putative copper resistance protein D